MKKAEWHRLKRLNERFPQRGEASESERSRDVDEREGTRRARFRAGEEGGRIKKAKGGRKGRGDSSASTRHYVAAGTNLYKGEDGDASLRVNRARGAD